MKTLSNVAHPIDFIIPWVDDTDANWLALQRTCRASTALGTHSDTSKKRYRDWGTLKYWFRSIEEQAPWVNRIHFVTCGHLPSWLNTEHPKLNIVEHKDYIPAHYLPTFNSNTIELNFHRIASLSEHFVLFNDDVFLLRKTKPTDFFSRGLPCASAVMNPYRAEKGDWFLAPLTSTALLNEHFSARRSIMRHPFKWLNPKYGSYLFRTATMLPYPYFFGFHEFHIANSYLKSSFSKVWEAEAEQLEETCSHTFREPFDTSHWLIENWQFAEGTFHPRSTRFGITYQLRIDFQHTLGLAVDCITKRKRHMVCINDADLSADQFERAKNLVRAALQTLYPVQSAYEKTFRC